MDHVERRAAGCSTPTDEPGAPGPFPGDITYTERLTDFIEVFVSVPESEGTCTTVSIDALRGELMFWTFRIDRSEWR